MEKFLRIVRLKIPAKLVGHIPDNIHSEYRAVEGGGTALPLGQ
jgi:hypothetical protein